MVGRSGEKDDGTVWWSVSGGAGSDPPVGRRRVGMRSGAGGLRLKSMGFRSAQPNGHRLVAPAVVMALAAAALALAVSLTRGRDAPAADSSASAARGAIGAPGTTEAADVVPSTTAGTAASTPSSVAPPLERDDRHRWLWTDAADLRFVWQDGDGVPYGQLQAARRALEDEGETVLAITNGGIYRPGLVPLGLYVEDGVELTPLNRDSGSGQLLPPAERGVLDRG